MLGTQLSFNANDTKLCAGIAQQSHSLVSTWDNCAAGTSCRDAGSPAQVSPLEQAPTTSAPETAKSLTNEPGSSHQLAKTALALPQLQAVTSSVQCS